METLVLTPGCWRHLPQAFLLFLTQEQVAKGILLCWDTTAGKQSTFRGEEDFSFSLGRKHPERTNIIPNAPSDAILPLQGHSEIPPLSALLFFSESHWLPGFT